MALISEKLRAEIERAGMSVREFQQEVATAAEEGAKGTSYASVYDYVEGRVAQPPIAFLKAAARVLGVRSAWLAFDEGARTEEEHRDQVRREGTPVWWHEEGPVLDLVAELADGWDERLGQSRASGRRAALTHFAKWLLDIQFVGAAWQSVSGFRRVLEAAATFLDDVDAVFEKELETEKTAGLAEIPDRQRYGGAHGPPAPVFRLQSDSRVYWAVWYDAALGLFSQRIYGIGERAPKGMDQH